MRKGILNDGFHYKDEFCDGGHMTQFFNELGSGSPSEVPDGATEDDDVLFEKQQQVVIVFFIISLFFIET